MLIEPPAPRKKLAHKGLFIVAVPLVLGSAFLLILYVMLAQTENEASRKAHANEVIGAVFSIGREVFKTLNSVTAYSFLRSEALANKYEDSRRISTEQLMRLRQATADDPEQREHVDRVGVLYKRFLLICDGMKESVDGGADLVRFMAAKSMRTQIESTVEQCTDELLAVIELVEKASSADLLAGAQMRQYMKGLILLGVLVNFVVSTSLVLLFSREITKRVGTLTDNASRLARGQALLPPVGGEDEIMVLDAMFHNMARALEEAESKQRSLIDNAVDVICSVDKHNRFVAVSPSCSTVWDIEAEALIGCRLVEIIDPRDKESTLAAFENIKLAGTRSQVTDDDDIDESNKILNNQTERFLSSAQIESRVSIKDRDPLHVLWSVYWSPREETFYCVAHDITARKQVETLIAESERRIRSIMNGLPVGLLVVGAEGSIEFSNPKARAMFKLAAREQFGERYGAFIFELLAPESSSHDENARRNFIAKHLLGETQNAPVELLAFDAAGEIFPVEVSVSEITVQDQLLKLVAIADVSERHEIERLKREFVAMVSHDLRTPLSSVQGMLALLSEGVAGELPGRAKTIVGTAEGQLERLIHLINDLLDLQKMESGVFSIEQKEVSLAYLFDSSVQSVRRLAENYGVSIKIDVGEDDSERPIYADGDRIIQVIVNLLSNAIKFSDEGGTVVLACRRSEAEGRVRISVSDNGRGIPDSHMETIFERFKQVERADATEKRGTGLGLSICKMIVEGHGGEIGVTSRLGEGSTFWFSIPSK